MILTCYVVDDEADACQLLKAYIDRTPYLNLSGMQQDPLKAIDELTGPDSPHITFVDVDMKQLSGIDLAGIVNPYTSVVFTTAYPEFAAEAFEKDAYDFMIKPFNYERFLQCVVKVKKRLLGPGKLNKLAQREYFNIKSEQKGRIVKLKYTSVMYVEGAQNYINVHTTETKHMTYLTVQEIEQSLPVGVFTRVHRSFIVNIDYVRVIERNRIIMSDNTEIMLGDFYKQSFLELMDAHLIKSKRN